MKELTKDQKWLYRKIFKICKDKRIVAMSYEDLFLTLDRIKICYALSFGIKDKKTREIIRKNIEKEVNKL